MSKDIPPSDSNFSAQAAFKIFKALHDAGAALEAKSPPVDTAWKTHGTDTPLMAANKTTVMRKNWSAQAARHAALTEQGFDLSSWRMREALDQLTEAAGESETAFERRLNSAWGLTPNFLAAHADKLEQAAAAMAQMDYDGIRDIQAMERAKMEAVGLYPEPHYADKKAVLRKALLGMAADAFSSDPSPEKRIFKAFRKLFNACAMLEAKQPPVEVEWTEEGRADVVHGALPDWEAGDLAIESLARKGWPVFHQPGYGGGMDTQKSAFNVVVHQLTDDAGKSELEMRRMMELMDTQSLWDHNALAYIKTHLDDIYDVANDLRAMDTRDIARARDDRTATFRACGWSPAR